jgi:WD40 repeat protein/tRNA A-37 threonylcarbamoyl transferase component Bud32
MAQECAPGSEREERLQAILLTYLEAEDNAQPPDPRQLLDSHPEFRTELEEFFAGHERMTEFTAPLCRAVQAVVRGDLSPGETPRNGFTPTAPLPSLSDYELLEEVGRGGMGVVYKARQRSLNRVVALKMIRAGRLASAADVQRFRNEAETAAGLDHPGIVPIYEVGECDGQPFFSMKLLEGGSLATLPRTDADPARLRRAAELVATVARAVHHAHQRGVLHRDLKPANVLLDADGRPLVGDFGLSRRLEAVSDLTHSGQLLGTPSYMAPEQTSGRREALTVAADVYSLGAILYERLVGRPPFRGDTVLQTIEQLRTQEPTPPRQLRPNVPVDLETICLKCLAREPGRRYASAGDLADDLQRFLDGEPVRARSAGWWERACRQVRRHPVRAALVAFGLLAGFGTAGGVLWHTTRLGKALAEVHRREHDLREHLYAAEMHLAYQVDWGNGDPRQMWRRLGQFEPTAGEDIRDFAFHYLHRLSHSGDATLYHHQGEVFGVAVAPDGRTLASCGEDGKVYLWDLAVGRMRATLEKHAGAVWSVAFAPDGRTLATAGADQVIRLWDVDRGEERATLPGHAGGTLCVAFSPDGRLLASGGRDLHARVWDVASGRQVANVNRGCDVVAIAFTPDCQRIDLQQVNGVVAQLSTNNLEQGVQIVWEGTGGLSLTQDGRKVAVGRADGRVTVQGDGQSNHLLGHVGAVRCVAFAPHERFLASGGDDSTVRVWDHRVSGPYVVFRGHTSRVNCVAFAPDGRRIVSGGADGAVKWWDCEANQEAEELRPAQLTQHAALSADGGTVALARPGGTMRLLDPVTWQERADLRGHAGGISAVALTPDGRTAATAGGDWTVRLWDTKTDRELAVLPQAAIVIKLAFSPDGRYLAEGDRDGATRLFDMTTRQEQQLGRVPGTWAEVLAFSPDGLTLAGGAGGRVTLWKVPGGQERARFDVGFPLQGLAFTPDGRTLIGAGMAERLVFWDLANPGPPAFAGEGMVRDSCHPLVVSPDGKLLAVGAGAFVRLVDTATGRLRRQLEVRDSSYPTFLAFSPDGRWLLSASTDGRVCRWDLDGYTVTAPPGQPIGSIRGLAFTPDGKTLLTGSDDPVAIAAVPWWSGGSVVSRGFVKGNTAEAVRLWDTATGRQRGTLALPDWVQLSCLALAPDGRTAAGGCTGGVVRVWDLAAGQGRLTLFTDPADCSRWQQNEMLFNPLVPSMVDFKTGVQALAFAPDGCLLATANGGTVALWDPRNGQEVRRLCQGPADTTCLAFAPDGATLALNRGAGVELWEVAGGRLRTTLDGHADTVCSLAFSPDGRLLASGGKDRQVKLWDLVAGGEPAPLAGHRDRVATLAFSRDGRTLASGSWDATVRLWHVSTRLELFALPAPTKVAAVAFAPDGRTLAAGTTSNWVGFWRADGRP